MSLPQRNFLPHDIPSWVNDGAIYYITICTEQRGKNFLCHEKMAAQLFESISFNHVRQIWWPHLVLFMPDHLHGLFSFAPMPGMKKAISDWKHYVGRKYGIEWQRDFFDHRLRRDESYSEKASYIRENPVRADLIKSAADWPYVRVWETRISIG